MKSILNNLGLAVLCLCGPGSALGSPVEPGIYEQLMLASSADGRLVGYYREVQGENPSKACAFYLIGQTQIGESRVLTWSSMALPGKIHAIGSGISLAIPHGRDHAGCGLVLLPQVETGIDLTRTARTAWIDLRRVAADRTWLFDSPGAGVHRKAYLVRNDVVGIVSRSGDWLRIEYPGRQRIISGWVRLSDTQAITPPKDSR